jgi:hypothetical protein
MKKNILIMTMAVSLLVCSIGILAQTMQTQLNQLELMKKSLGTWQANVGNDTVEIWDYQQFGKTCIINVYQVIKGKKTPLYINNMGFDSKGDKYKGYVLYSDGNYLTWIGLFKDENKFLVDIVDNFIPEKIWTKFEMVHISSKEMNWTQFNAEGVKVSELKFVKTK